MTVLMGKSANIGHIIRCGFITLVFAAVSLVSVAAQDIPTGVDRIFAPANDDLDIDSTDDWRVDVDVAVLDTGVDMGVAGLTALPGGGPKVVDVQDFSRDVRRVERLADRPGRR